MSRETFSWRPINSPQGEIKFRRTVAQFGDGYRQAVGDGINNKMQSWPLQFQGSAAELAPMLDFLDRHAGVMAFYWTPPLGVQGVYEAVGYNPVPVGGGVYTVSVTFQQIGAV